MLGGSRASEHTPNEEEPVMAKERGEKVVATNRRARHDYLIEDTYEAGMVLNGTEVKSLREGRASLDAVHIPEYTEGTWNNHAPRRKRKLLLHKQEIVKISHKTSQGGYTLVPMKIYFHDGRAKVEIAVAKGKREFDKRQALREKTDKREAERAMRSRNRLGE
jgi:SsrA-binding protein